MKEQLYEIADIAPNINPVTQSEIENGILTDQPGISARENLFHNYSSEQLFSVSTELKNLLEGFNKVLSAGDSTQVYNLMQEFFIKKNYFDNGGMQIFQRGAAHTLVKDVYGFAVDRWAGMATGTLVSAGTLNQETSSTLNDTELSLKFAGITLTGTGILYLRQRISAQDAIKLKNKKLSIQFQVNQDTGGAIDYTIYARKADALNDFTTSTNIANSGATSVSSGVDTEIKWENITIGDCSNGLEIEIKIECGAITTKNFEISNAKLEISEVITSFVNEDDVINKLKCHLIHH